ncbi:hypothetical protein [Nonomuraea longicatena]|uniref:Uncharacterized protein n=1 Tax=Nonomuraea longicatena TaxID=83682 RepID=A0ABN1NNB6_9ACTN
MIDARHARVAEGLSELELWLGDQIRGGLAASGPEGWSAMARRLVDAQAPGAAGLVSRLVRLPASGAWPERLLAEYSLLRLLAVAYRRRAHLPPPLARTVLTRVGFPVARAEVLAAAPVRDHWRVVGSRVEEEDRVTAQRVWLRGRDSGRAALLLAYVGPGRPLPDAPAVGACLEIDLRFYPGAAPLRALASIPDVPFPGAVLDASVPGVPVPVPGVPVSGVSVADGGSGGLCATTCSHASSATACSCASSAAACADGPPIGEVPAGVSAEQALSEVGAALAADPWTDSWPVVVTGTVAELGGLGFHWSFHDPWRLIAVSGGRPVTVAAEWTPYGLRPMTVWDEDGSAVVL